MIYLKHLLVLLCASVATCSTTEETALILGEKRISEYVLAILEHYKQTNPIGVPGVPVPDPLDIPNMQQTITGTKMSFKNCKLYGLSKFRIVHIKADLTAMQVDAALEMDVLNVFGNYNAVILFQTSRGPFSVRLSDVYVQAIAKIEVEPSGKLEAQEMNMDITFKHIAMKFENTGMLASVIQGAVNSGGSFLFDSIKPYILKEVNTNMRTDINKQIRLMPQTFPNSISPFDQVVAEARRRVRHYNYDPFKIEDYNYTSGIFGIQMTHTWLTGLSSFHRVGNMTFEMRNNTIYLEMEVGTQRLKGSTHWEVVVFGGMMSRPGTASFSVEYLTVKVAVSQTADIRNSPKLNDLQLELGNIQIRCDGAGTLDYIIEFGINVIPNLLRYQIMDAIETPLKNRIQEILNSTDIEQIIHENLPKLDEQQKNGFKGILT